MQRVDLSALIRWLSLVKPCFLSRTLFFIDTKPHVGMIFQLVYDRDKSVTLD
jgi:hypothetical protein